MSYAAGSLGDKCPATCITIQPIQQADGTYRIGGPEMPGSTSQCYIESFTYKTLDSKLSNPITKE